jgi:hypothetical protein
MLPSSMTNSGSLNPREELLVLEQMNLMLELPPCLWALVFDFFQEHKSVPLSRHLCRRDVWLCSHTMALSVRHLSERFLVIHSSPSDMESFKFPWLIRCFHGDMLQFDGVDVTQEMWMTWKWEQTQPPYLIHCERWLGLLCSKLCMKVYVKKTDWQEELD